MSWDIAALRDAVEQKFGEEQALRLRPFTDSIKERFRFAGFHLSEAKRVLSTYLSEDTDISAAFMLEFDIDHEQHGSYLQAKWHAAAHAVAGLQSAHAWSDHLAHILYFGLGLNLNAHSTIEEHKISLKVLRNCLGRSQRYSALNVKIDELMNSDWSYVDDIVNYSKHRSIIKPNVEHFASPVDGRCWDLQFPQFKKGTNTWEQRSVFTFLFPECQRQLETIVQIGRRLHEDVVSLPNRTGDN